MNFRFEKYQATGNHFILIDDTKVGFPSGDIDLIIRLCKPGFGIGSDGLMLIRNHSEADFEMIFYNPDGSKSLCGNGSRCAVDFAVKHKIAPREGTLITTDGSHKYRMLTQGDVELEMHPVETVQKHLGYWFIDTGSPHLIVPVDNIARIDVANRGRALRNEPVFIPIGGTNVNFVEATDKEATYKVRTYERGVEAETLSCGTGVTAVALATSLMGEESNRIILQTNGGVLEVDFLPRGQSFENITLKGPAQYVFTGEIYA